MTTVETDRRVRVALNADVVGYSRLLADDFDRTTLVMEEYHHLVAEQVEANVGTLLNFVGDNFMALFDESIDAVQAAIGIATAVEERNQDLPTSQWVRFRMGMDLGEVAETDGQQFGDALNIAARIEAIAKPGGLLISGPVYRALDEPALRFRPLGRRGLKNIPEEVEVYEFADLPSNSVGGGERRPLSLEAPTVAVLPIHTDGADESVSSTAGVLRSDLVHRLSQVPGLSVIDARTTAGPQPSDVAARYITETGAMQFGDRVRVFATLYDVTTMNVVKSHKWTVATADLFDLSETMADEVARAIEVELIIGEPAGLYSELEDPEAIEKVYLGWYHLRSGNPQSWAKAVELFGQVAEMHPDQPYGHTLAAFANWIGAENMWTSNPDKTYERAREQATRAREMDDPTGMAQAVEAAILMSQGREEDALKLVEELEIIRPTCDVTYGLEASVRRYLGQWEKAVDLTEKAMQLTGINKPWYPTVQACSFFIGGRVEQAASIAEMVLEYQPNNLEALLVLVAAQVELGMDRRARATADLIHDRFPGVDVEAWLDRNPYKIAEVVDRWKSDLSAAGAIVT